MTESTASRRVELKARGAEFNPALYDEIAPGYYDKVYWRGRGVQWFWHIERYAAVAANLPAGARSLLDLGCGPGTFLGNYCEKFEDCVGVDLAVPQIEYASATYGNAHRRFEAADAVSYLGKRQFDVVVSIEVIEHLPVNETQEFLRTAYELLAPGGTVILATPNYSSLWPIIELFVSKAGPVDYRPQHINHFTVSRIERELSAAGFELLNARTIFVISPFLAALSTGLARACYKAEQALLPRFGSEIVVAARRPA